MQLSFNGKFKPNNGEKAKSELYADLSKAQEEIRKALNYELPPWKNRQDEKKLDSFLSLIHCRTSGADSIDTWEKCRAFAEHKASIKSYEYPREKFLVDAKHKFINSQSHAAFYKIICSHPRITPHGNPRSRRKDFWIDKEIYFDLKVSRFPKTSHPEKYLNDPFRLASNLYRGQGWSRFEWQNRLIVVCYNLQGDHTNAKANIIPMFEPIWSYFDNFNPGRLMEMDQVKLMNKTIDPKNNIAYCDILLNFLNQEQELPLFEFNQ